MQSHRFGLIVRMQYTALAATILFQCCARALLRGAKLTEEIPLKVHSLESLDPLYTVQLVVGQETVNSIVDTGSTGLIVAKKNAARKQKTCSGESKQCDFQTTWRFTFLTCFADGTGYFVNPVNQEVQFGKLPTTKVTVGSAIGVFDPDRSMLSNDDQVFVSILGCGGHGNSDCAFSYDDAITQIIEKNSLQPIWSLRSLTATLEGRMYIGASPQIFRSSTKQQYTSLNQYKGKYIVVLSGFLVAGTGRRSHPAKQGLSPTEIILDTGKF